MKFVSVRDNENGNFTRHSFLARNTGPLASSQATRNKTQTVLDGFDGLPEQLVLRPRNLGHSS